MTHPDRQIVEMLSTRVPCALSANGTHMLTIGISGSKELVYLHAPCEQMDRRICKSAHMLEAVTCSTAATLVRKGFQRHILTGDAVKQYLNEAFAQNHLFRKAMHEILVVANRIGASRIWNHQVTSTYPSKTQLRKSAVVTSWLQRNLPRAFQDQFVIVWKVGRNSPAGLFHVYGERSAGLWCVAEVADGKFILNSDTIRSAFRNNIGINEYGKCVYCDATPTRPTRHTNSTKHRTAVIAAIRCAVHLLNNHKITKLINNTETEK
jgi:hypothetical protein